MKKQNFKLTTILFGLIVLCSCNNNSEEITQLKKENEELRSKIEVLKKSIPNDTDFKYTAIALPVKRKIKLGEEYVAGVYLCIENKNNPLKVVLCNLVNDQPVPTKDTLNRSRVYNCPEYRVKPKKVGTYVWSGKISRTDAEGLTHSYFFKSEYEVTN